MMNGAPEKHPQQLVDHLFRHEAGKMIAVLTGSSASITWSW